VKPLRAALLPLLLMAGIVHADILVHGHRGARGVRPENTLAAFQYALEIGVDVLELDLVVSKDNVLVVNHDLWVNADLCLLEGERIESGMSVRSLTLEQLKQFDCGSLGNARFPDQVLQPGQRIPALGELFRLVANSALPAARKVNFNIETKISRQRPGLTPTPEQYANLLVSEIRAFELEDRVIIQSFDYRTLKWSKKLAPEIKVSQLSDRSYVDLVAAARSVQAEYISPNWKSISADMVKEFHAGKLRVAPWTANTPEAWDYLVEIGADEIITDYPGALMDYLRERQLRP
jgi:glycerophosphoryl diester phosphodiesterase